MGAYCLLIGFDRGAGGPALFGNNEFFSSFKLQRSRHECTEQGSIDAWPQSCGIYLSFCFAGFEGIVDGGGCARFGCEMGKL